MNSWIITVPKTTPWEEYLIELDAVLDYSQQLNYRVPHFPKEMGVGDHCYIVWNGKVRGWMEIVDLVNNSNSFKCTTTGTQWGPGKYIQRSGPFHSVDGPEMTGFRGIRKYKEELNNATT